MMEDTSLQAGLLGLTAQIVSAHAGNNKTAAKDLPRLIEQVHAALRGSAGAAPQTVTRAAAPQERAKPAVPINKSVTSAYIVCLEDGRKLKTLKRHLNTAYNMSPQQYRAKWGLDADYPMVARDYAEKRSALAKAIGLGTRPRGGRRT